MNREQIADVLGEHHAFHGIMASPNHWAYRKGWFAHCGSSWEDQPGCGWDSAPHTFETKEEAQRAALAHVAEQIVKAQETPSGAAVP